MMNERKGNRFAGKRTICEVHRQLYDLLVIELSKDEKHEQLLINVDKLLSEAFGMGISLCKSLLDYKLALPKWKRIENRKELVRLRDLRNKIVRSKLRC